MNAVHSHHANTHNHPRPHGPENSEAAGACLAGVSPAMVACWQLSLAQLTQPDLLAAAQVATATPLAMERKRADRAFGLGAPEPAPAQRGMGSAPEAAMWLPQDGGAGDTLRMGVQRADGARLDLIAHLADQQLVMALRLSPRHLADPDGGLAQRLLAGAGQMRSTRFSLVYSEHPDHAQ